MSVRDLWTKADPDHPGKRIRTKRWGIGSRWQVPYTDLEGRRTAKSFDNKETAELFDARVRVDKDAGVLISKNKAEVTLEELWKPWYDSKAEIAEKTRKDYLSNWRVHIRPQWGRRRVSEIQEHQVVAWLANLKNKKGVHAGEPLGSSQRRKIALVLHSMLDLAVRLKVVNANPLTAPAPRQKAAERRYLTIEEVDALLAAAPHPQAKLMLEVLLRTGLRIGEAKGLKVKDLDLTRKRLMIRRDVDDLGHIDETKSRHHREVPISQVIALALNEATEGKDPEEWLLPDEHGRVWTTARWRVVWSNLLIFTGIDQSLKTHELRHTAVSMAIAGGADVYVVMRMCGHASAATTLKHYGHLWDQGLDQAAEAIEEHLERERKRIEAQQARRAQAEKDSGVRHLRVVR